MTAVCLKSLPGSFQNLQESVCFQPASFYTCGGELWDSTESSKMLEPCQNLSRSKPFKKKKKKTWESLFEWLGVFTLSTLALVNIHVSTIKRKVDENEIHGRTPTHKPLLGGKKEKLGPKISRWNPESKNVLQQINKDPTVKGRKADGACMWMYMSPYPDSPASVHAKGSAQPPLTAQTCF